jgi:hypothetical protein
MASSDPQDQQLSNTGSTITIAGRVWKIGDKIHSKGVSAVGMAKMLETFGDQHAQANAEGELLGKGSSKKYRVKWTNISGQPIMEYGASHGVFKDPSADRLQKRQKNDAPARTAAQPAGTNPSAPNTADESDDYPSSDEVLESDDESSVPANPNPLKIGQNEWREDTALDGLDPRGTSAAGARKPRVRWPQRLSEVTERTAIDYLNHFMPGEIISYAVQYTNARIEKKESRVSKEEMMRWIGVMYAMTIQPVDNIMDYWREDEEGFLLAPKFSVKTGMSCFRFKFIRQHFALGDQMPSATVRVSTFDNVRPLFEIFNSHMKEIFIV